MTAARMISRCVIGTTLAAATLLCDAARARAADRPNVVLIMADDLGFGDVGFNGHPVVKTPALDQMAREGIRLGRFYAGAPVCTPTRASVMTGRNGFRSGTHWASSAQLPDEEITIAELLRGAGYRTGLFGKWHLGKLTPDGAEVFRTQKPKPTEFMPPWKQGFDVCFTAEFSVPTYNPLVWDFEWIEVPDGKDKPYVMNRPLAYGEGTITGKPMVRWPLDFWHEGGRKSTKEIAGDSSALVTDEALKFIAGAAEAKQPFFAVVWLFTPHSPTAAGAEDRAKYANLDIEQQHWFGSITAMDAQIGRVRDELARLGVAQNTLVHFCSDNGPSWIHDRGSAGPFRGRKGELYEGGIRVPAVVEWPAQLKGQRVIDTPMSTDDLLPTIAAITGAEAPNDRPLDGENVLPILQAKTTARSAPLYFHSLLRKNPLEWEAGEAKQSAVTDGRWKLISVDNHKTFELYDLDQDAGEKTNLAAKDPARVERMKSLLETRITSFAASGKGQDYRATNTKVISP
jgi:arylsulfatase A-like enzyme